MSPLHRRDPPPAHRAGEILYKAMEDFQIDVVIGQGREPRRLAAHNPSPSRHHRAGLLSTPAQPLRHHCHSISTIPTSWWRSSAQRRHPGLRIDADAARAVAGARAARRASPTDCCAGCGFRQPGKDGVDLAAPGSLRASRSTRPASTRWTARSCWPSSTSSPAGGRHHHLSTAVRRRRTPGGHLRALPHPGRVPADHLPRPPGNRQGIPIFQKKLPRPEAVVLSGLPNLIIAPSCGYSLNFS